MTVQQRIESLHLEVTRLRAWQTKRSGSCYTLVSLNMLPIANLNKGNQVIREKERRVADRERRAKKGEKVANYSHEKEKKTRIWNSVR